MRDFEMRVSQKLEDFYASLPDKFLLPTTTIFSFGIREQDGPDKPKGVCLMLAGMLVQQLNGVFTIDREQGTPCILEFDA